MKKLTKTQLSKFNKEYKKSLKVHRAESLKRSNEKFKKVRNRKELTAMRTEILCDGIDLLEEAKEELYKKKTKSDEYSM